VLGAPRRGAKLLDMRKILGIAILFALGLAISAGLSAQTAPPAPPKEPAATFRANAQEVVLDVIVRDSHGRPVKNLQPADLQIFENGTRQQISSFRLVQSRETVRTVPSLKAEKGAQPATQPAPAANPLKAMNLLCIVFENLDAFTRKYAVEAAQEFLKYQFDPNTWVGVFNLDTQLSVLAPFTTNRNEIMQAAAQAFTGRTVDFDSSANAILNASPNVMTIEVAVNGNPANGGSVAATMKITGGELNPLANTGADVSTDAGANAARGDLADQRRMFGGIEGMRQTDQILAMITQLQGLPGRKSVLLLSPGLTTTGDPERFQSIIDKANAAGVTFYALDVTGLDINSNGLASGEAMGHAASLSANQSATSGASTKGGVQVNANTGNGSAAANMERMRQSDYIHDAVRTTDTQASLRALSEKTGGFLIANTNDFRKSFQKIVDDLDTHYEVTYKPSDARLDGRLRNIQVKTERAGLNLQSRTGYFALPPLGPSTEPAPFEMAALAALNVHTPPHTFAFQGTSYQFRPEAAKSQDALAFELPASELTATPDAVAKIHRLHSALYALIEDSTGQVVDKFSQDISYQIPDDKFSAAQKSTIMFTHPLSLPPGHYKVETAVLDRESGRASVSSMNLDSHERKGVALSSIMMVQRLEPVNGKVDAGNPFEFQAQPTQGARVIPELATNLRADAHPNVYFVVYPDAANPQKPKIQVELLVAGKLLAKQSADLPAPDASGAIPMVTSAPGVPGDCELRVTAMQGDEKATQSLVYQIAK
jgi:VWFA-related protein